MAEKKKAPAKKKAAPKKAPAPKVEAANPVGRPKNVVKLTETDLSYEMKNFIAVIHFAHFRSMATTLRWRLCASRWRSASRCRPSGDGVEDAADL